MSDLAEHDPGLVVVGGFFTSRGPLVEAAQNGVRAGLAPYVEDVFTFPQYRDDVEAVLEVADGSSLAAFSAGNAVLDQVIAQIEATDGEFMPEAVYSFNGPERFSLNNPVNSLLLAGKGVVRQLEYTAKGLVLPGEEGEAHRRIALDSITETVFRPHRYLPAVPGLTRGSEQSRGSTNRRLDRLAELGVGTVARIVARDDHMFLGAHEISPTHPDVIEIIVPGGHDRVLHDATLMQEVRDSIDATNRTAT